MHISFLRITGELDLLFSLHGLLTAYIIERLREHAAADSGEIGAHIIAVAHRRQVYHSSYGVEAEGLHGGKWTSVFAKYRLRHY